jgi:hypothetical protein
MVGIRSIASGQQIDLHPGNEEVFEGNLRIVNASNRLIKIAFDSAERQVGYQFRNQLGNEKSSNLILGGNIARIEIRNAEDGIAFNYFLRD